MSKNLKKYDETLSFKYKNTQINANVIYRSRKNITIQIKPVDEVVIISPKKVPKEVLKDILIEKSEWIAKKLEEYKELGDYHKEKEYISGEKFFYLGKEYTLDILEEPIDNKNTKINIEIKDDKLVISSNSTDKDEIKNSIKMWYRKESEKIVLERIIHCREKYPTMMKLIPNSVKVKEQKKRWGSCTSKRDIYINSKISMAKPEVIDYIIVHEFCHLIHMNHSKDFYELVESIMPNYKIHEKWLKDSGYKLTL